ncbi:aminoglycoside 6-adenylyltransferase [Paenibacillus sp. FSL R5-0527]|uniref:aminoglycoside 6-adenylyltransferase n=1 Tax=Paenibacillus TaxID=44249 RepID=UPI000979DF14|nr:aminoglycoside 6-adenylyltransferase [Paenibacillus macerans]MEC0333196.1 aminoglycoside 6-adenylyltransferase [Paenibacillus macerans]OMG51506.1 aminoglycoside adenylyltransferase [Paenibacillus macerans]
MRSEQEMMQMILDYAKNDDRVRAVGMNGSRTNPNAPKDRFKDYDIVFLVTDMNSFIGDNDWVDCFGSRIIMQTPEDMKLLPPELDGNYSYLMLFSDGNRIDLTLCPVEKKANWNNGDKLSIVLLDKDRALPHLPEPTDQDYWVKRPSAALYADCCNEFWWVSTYVAKGLWRREMTYAMDHLNICVRPMLIKMLEWKVGLDTGFSLSTGKNGKYLEKYLPKQSWLALMSTYPQGTYDAVWHALFTALDLFRGTAKEVAEQLNYEYPLDDDRNVTAYLKRVQQMET